MNKTGGPVTFLNPGIALIRHQFLEILLRLAIKRYYDSGEANSNAEAIRMLFEYNLRPTYGKFASQAFRDMKFWNEEIDNFYKVHLDIVDHLYLRYGGKKIMPGEDFFLHVTEFERLVYDAGLMSQKFVSRDVALCYNLSMMSQVNELTQDRHLKMSFVEFLECLARTAERLSLRPHPDKPPEPKP